MNKPEPLPSSTLLNGGEIVSVKLNSGESVLVKVRLLPERHLEAYLDFRDTANEAPTLELVLQRNVAKDGERPCFEFVNLADEAQRVAQAQFVDSIQSDSFAELIEIADKLNFERAVWQAERRIARGNALIPLKRRVSAVMMQPLMDEFRSQISSLTTQLLSAAPAKKPETSQSPG